MAAVPEAVYYLMADGPLLDASVVVALLAAIGGILATVGGVIIARILTTNKEEMTRLQGVEDSFRVLEDYCGLLRDWGITLRETMRAAGMPVEPVPPWPPELRRDRSGQSKGN
jgi:hypothetical protein